VLSPNTLHKFSLHKFLFNAISHNSRDHTRFWLTLSVVVTLAYSLVALDQAFSAEYFIPDDARQHIFWMQRFVEPGLFPQDWLADYFQSLAPPGYYALYWLGAKLGCHPFTLAKILPSVLGLFTTLYGFRLCQQILPIPFAGFIATVLLNQNLWMQDGLSSGTARAFIYPLTCGFLYYLLQPSLRGCALSIALLGLFYPPLCLVGSALLVVRLGDWSRMSSQWPPQWQSSRQSYYFCFVGLGMVFLVLAPQVFWESAEFGPVVSLTQAKGMPEFLAGGRLPFFLPGNPWDFWFNGNSGLNLAGAITSPLMVFGLLLPILLRFKSWFPLSQKLTIHIHILWQQVLASVILFLAAHALLFHLYFPNRYTQHSFRIVLPLASAIALTLVLSALLSWSLNQRQRLISWTTTVVCITVILGQAFYPQLTLNTFPKLFYIQGGYPQLYQFFQQQPRDIMIASISDYANDIPSFAGRSILMGSEYGIPFHMTYYQEFSRRTIDLVEAQYSTSPLKLNQFIDKYEVDFWLLEEAAFNLEYLQNNRWLQQFQPQVNQAINALEQGDEPILKQRRGSCTVFTTGILQVISTKCLLDE
jgi:hypothetical protein